MPSACADLVAKARLADAGLTGQQVQAAAPGACIVEAAQQLGELDAAPHEGTRIDPRRALPVVRRDAHAAVIGWFAKTQNDLARASRRNQVVLAVDSARDQPASWILPISMIAMTSA
jgi:hypothetical protein